MKRNENEIDQLTRSLMQETVLKPSSTLNSRIMTQLQMRVAQKNAVSIRKPLSPGLLFALFLVYILAIIAGVVLFRFYGETLSGLLTVLQVTFPILLTIVGGASFFILFSILDVWLQQHGYKLPEE